MSNMPANTKNQNESLKLTGPGQLKSVLFDSQLLDSVT